MAEASYEIRIRGRVSAALLDSFEGMASELEPVGPCSTGRSETSLSCTA